MPITELEQVTESRLCWPDSKPRAAQRIDGPFKGQEVSRVSSRIDDEMGRWRVPSYILSRNNQRIYAGDPGAALWWNDKRRELRVLACDKYKKLADNLHAIELTLCAMRALERWGAYTAEQAAEGARPLALPAPGDTAINWRSLLGYVDGLDPEKQLVLCEHAYRSKSREAAGDETKQRTLNLAIEAARNELAA